MSNNLDQLKKTQLKILRDIIDICEQNDLTYFLIAGTLIGAVRHNGFIPWDDDIDIAMTRSEYSKFKDLITAEVDSQYFLQDYQSENQYYNAFAKIRLNNTLYDEESILHLDIHKGIFVDIFILDDLSRNDGLLYHTKGKAIQTLGDLISYKHVIKGSKSITSKQKIILAVITILPSNLLKKLQVSLMQSSKSKNKYLVNFGCQYGYMKQTYLYSDYFPPQVAVFEGLEVLIPNNYDKILSKVYGEYMKIPDEEDRISHSPIEVKF